MRGRNGTFHHYYYCAGHDVLYARRAVGLCPQRNLRSDELDALVWGEVRRHLENPALIREGYARLQVRAESPADDGLADDVAALEKQLAELDREEYRLLDAYQAGLVDLDQLRQRQGRLRQRRAHVNGSVEVLHTERKTAQQQAQLQADLETFVDRIRGPLATLDFDARQQLVRTVLERVMVEDGRVDIHFAIPLPDPPPDTNHSVSARFHLRSNGNDHRGELQAAGEASSGRPEDPRAEACRVGDPFAGVVMIMRPTPWRAQTGTRAHAPVPRHAALRPAWRLSGGSARWNAPPAVNVRPVPGAESPSRGSVT